MPDELDTLEPITIVVDDDADSHSEAPAEGAVVDKKPEDHAMADIEDLKRQVRNADAVAEEASRRAEDERHRRESAEREASQYRTVASEHEYNSLLTAIQAAVDRLDSLQAAHTAALEAGNYDTVSKLQLDIARETTRLQTMENGKYNIEQAKERQKDQPPPTRQDQPIDWSRPWNSAEADRVLRESSPASAAWMRDHNQFFSDVGFRQQVTAAHSFVVAKGIRADTPEYFREVEKLVGVAGDDEPTRQSQADEVPPARTPAAPPRTPAAPAAPVSRSVPSSPGQRTSSQTIVLSREQREMARTLFHDHPNPEQAYARNLIALEKEGKLKKF